MAVRKDRHSVPRINQTVAMRVGLLDGVMAAIADGETPTPEMLARTVRGQAPGETL
jgi:hypothetical protein